MRAFYVVLAALAFTSESNTVVATRQTKVLNLVEAGDAERTTIVHDAKLRKRVTAAQDQDEERAIDNALKDLPQLVKQLKGKNVLKFAHHLQFLHKYTPQQRDALVRGYAEHLANLAKTVRQ